MELREFFAEDAISLDLAGSTKDDILKELISLLQLGEKDEAMLFKMLKRRENLGSTGIGRGIAIPHCRSLVVRKLHFALPPESLPEPGRSHTDACFEKRAA
jgi:mannitol/fructose-specific phosphotransferase system IIA component (Ntr-type)